MDTREALTAHTNKLHKHLVQFQKLDSLREQAIDEAVLLCKEGKPYSTEKINHWTNKINEHAKQGISPTRVVVSEEMIKEYVNKK
ncbi:DUF2533 family protein [Chengkuizengella axinellae]|uniref:DUF2533 family protein n=1 Tax=Chengkuizengella axinellae TaxID=3064388 RepID=A0ABT9IY06_9BACL|nr:DUF2533 family protein [Chengkuizengella sp. 2205SS18-9]MDP5274256.1 DUF2533 family protein [Chengkuizengella sp. 2205SS18-9]